MGECGVMYRVPAAAGCHSGRGDPTLTCRDAAGAPAEAECRMHLGPLVIRLKARPFKPPCPSQNLVAFDV